MLAAHFPKTYGDKLEHQHSGIIGVMRVSRGGKSWRPNEPTARTLEDQSDELVTCADASDVEPSQMRIGLVVGEPLGREDLDRCYGGKQTLGSIEFEEEEEDGSVRLTRMEADGTLTVSEQKPAAPGASQRPAPARPSDAAKANADDARAPKSSMFVFGWRRIHTLLSGPCSFEWRARRA
jgi:hypothetical protein